MAECVWGHVLAVERVAGAGRCGGVFGDELFDGVCGEGLPLSGREQGVLRLSVAFVSHWRRTATVSGLSVTARCLRPLERIVKCA